MAPILTGKPKMAGKKQSKIIIGFLILILLTLTGFGGAETEQQKRFRAEKLKEAVSDDLRISGQAMFNMGQSYFSGDKVKAYMWYTLSAARYRPDAFYPVASLKKLIPQMTEEQIKTGEQMARKWMVDHWGMVPSKMSVAGIEELKDRLGAGDTRALNEMIRRAEAGDPAVQKELGELYWSGWGIEVKADPDKAFYWWTNAANGGDLEIMNKLGVIFLTGHQGRGISPHPRKGEAWLIKAGEKGQINAASLLATLYGKGEHGITQDMVKYRYWFEKWAEYTAAEGDYTIVTRLAGLYSGRVYDSSINSTWPKNSVRSEELYKMSANSGDHNAQIELGIIYLSGKGIKKNEQLALQYFLKAAATKAHVERALCHLVVMYEQGIGTGENREEAQKLLDRIMNNKDYTAGSLNLIGHLYHKGEYLPENDVMAAKYYKLSAIRGKPEAQYYMGKFLWEGLGVTQNPVEAYAWWSICSGNILDPNMYPSYLVKAALKKSSKSMTGSQKKAARLKARQLIKEYESHGIVLKDKLMWKILKKIYKHPF